MITPRETTLTTVIHYWEKYDENTEIENQTVYTIGLKATQEEINRTFTTDTVPYDDIKQLEETRNHLKKEIIYKTDCYQTLDKLQDKEPNLACSSCQKHIAETRNKKIYLPPKQRPVKATNKSYIATAKDHDFYCKKHIKKRLIAQKL